VRELTLCELASHVAALEAAGVSLRFTLRYNPTYIELSERLERYVERSGGSIEVDEALPHWRCVLEAETLLGEKL
jgi:hypothetical protein